MQDKGEHLKKLTRKVAGDLKGIREETHQAKSFVGNGGDSRMSELNLEGMTAK